MKKLAVLVVLALAVVAIVATYRSYRERSDAQLAARRSASDDRAEEFRRRAAAEKEAQRLSALKAEQEAAEAQRAIADLRLEEEAAQQARAKAEAESARLSAELDRLQRDKEAAEAEAKRLSTERIIEISAIEKQQRAALEKLGAVEDQRRVLTDRAARSAEALARQIELERAAQERLSRLRPSAPAPGGAANITAPVETGIALHTVTQVGCSGPREGRRSRSVPRFAHDFS